MRWLSVIACALALAGCKAIPATDRSLALVQPVPHHPNDVRIYSNLCDVRSAAEVVSELEVANAGRKPSKISHELANLAGQLGADAIVLHPFNRSKLGVAYTSVGPDSFDPLRYSRATAIRVLSGSSASETAIPLICGGG